MCHILFHKKTNKICQSHVNTQVHIHFTCKFVNSIPENSACLTCLTQSKFSIHLIQQCASEILILYPVYFSSSETFVEQTTYHILENKEMRFGYIRFTDQLFFD